MVVNKDLPAKSRMETDEEVLTRMNEWLSSWQGEGNVINVESIIVPDPYKSHRLYCFRVWVKDEDNVM